MNELQQQVAGCIFRNPKTHGSVCILDSGHKTLLKIQLTAAKTFKSNIQVLPPQFGAEATLKDSRHDRFEITGIIFLYLLAVPFF